MKKILLVSLGVLALVTAFFSTASAFNMTIAPAKKVFEMNRGESKSYALVFRNDFDTSDYQVRVVDFVYNDSGNRAFVEKQDLADPAQSLSTWVKVDEARFSATKGSDNQIPVTIRIPENANFGDHFGVLLIERYEGGEGAGPVTVGGSIASVLAVKVLGGTPIKSGGLVDYQVQTQERARNTVNFVVKFNNTGTEFYNVLAEVEVYDDAQAQDPIKVLSRDFTVFPNVVKEIKMPLGDLGDDYGEKEYYSRLHLSEFHNGNKVAQLGQSEKAFQYFIPVHAAADVLPTIEKPIVVESSLVQAVREFGLYIGAFIILLIVLIRVLFFSPAPVSQPPSRKKKS